MSFDEHLERDLLDTAEFVELINEERERTLRDADLTVASVAEVRDERRDRR